MSVLFGLAALFLLLASLWIIPETQNKIIAALILLVAFAAYWQVGAPELGDSPLAQRIAHIERSERASLTPDEQLALWKARARAQPDAHVPYTRMAELFAQHQRFSEAKTAYRQALRRDSTHIPALRGLADLIVQTEDGQVGQYAASLYKAAAQKHDPHSNFMLGLYHWQAGHADKARSLWDHAMTLLPKDSNLVQQLKQLRADIEAEPSVSSPPKSP